MKNKHKYMLSAIIFIILILITYFFIFHNYDINVLIASLKATNPRFVMMAVVCVFLYLFFESLFLKRIIYHLGYKIGFYNTFGYVLTEKYFSAITPSSMGGQPIQMLEMHRDKIGIHIGSIIVLLNTMMYKVALVVIATLGFILYKNELFSLNSLFNWLVLIGYLTTIFVIIFFGLLIYSPKIVSGLEKLLKKIVSKLKFLKKRELINLKISKSLKDYQRCAKITKEKPIIFLESFILLFFQRFFILAVSYFIYRAFGLNSFNLGELIAFQACITLGSDLIPTPGGVMANEGLVLVANQFIYGESLALSAMLLLRTINFYLLVLISAILYFVFHHLKRLPAEKI